MQESKPDLYAIMKENYAFPSFIPLRWMG